MNLKAAVRYRFNECKTSMSIFYSVILATQIIFIASVKLYGRNSMNLSAIEFSSCIFLFVLGLNSFKPQFLFLLQNGISRKTNMISYFYSTAIVAAIMSVLDRLVASVVQFFIPNYQSFFVSLYQIRFAQNISAVQMVFEQLLWCFFFYFAIGMFGFFLTTLYYQMAKWLKIVVSAGVPGLLFIVLPIIETNFTNGAISKTLFDFANFAFGFKNGANPYFAVITCAIASILFGSFVYLLVRKAEIKQ